MAVAKQDLNISMKSDGLLGFCSYLIGKGEYIVSFPKCHLLVALKLVVFMAYYYLGLLIPFPVRKGIVNDNNVGTHHHNEWGGFEILRHFGICYIWSTV